MFAQHFTFDTQPSPALRPQQYTSSTRDTSRSVSPCSSTTDPYLPPPRFTVNDLAASLANSRIRPDSQIRYDSCAAYANLDDDDAAWDIPDDDDDDDEDDSPAATSASRPHSHLSHSPARRIQRQHSTRMLCSLAHAKDIADLVSRMVDAKEQCEVADSDPVKRSSEMLDEDDDGGEMLSLSRRSSWAVHGARGNHGRTLDVKAGGARVSKTTRGGKKSRQRRRRSECA
jgi:hypothetical protein